MIPTSKFWHWAEKIGVTESRFPAAERWQADASHPAMRVNLDACIQCGLCVRACREVQVNDVIGMAYRNARRQDRVRLRRSDGRIDLRRLRRMRAGLPDRRADAGGLMLDEKQTRVTYADRKVDSLCPFCGVGCQVTYQVKDEKIDLCRRPRRAGQPQPALRQGPLRLRLHPSSRTA